MGKNTTKVKCEHKNIFCQVLVCNFSSKMPIKNFEHTPVEGNNVVCNELTLKF